MPGQRAGFIPAERHRGRYAQAIVPRRPKRRCPVRKPALQRPIAGLPPLGPDRARRTRTCAIGWRCCSSVDESLARILDALRDLGELDNTVFILTSDHGYFYGEHGLNEERRLAYEETARIPLIVRYPRVARAGAARPSWCRSIDLAPTILALAGVTDTVPRQGRSLVPLLEGANRRGGRRCCWSTTATTVFPRMLNMAYQAVRTERQSTSTISSFPGWTSCTICRPIRSRWTTSYPRRRAGACS